MNIANLPWMVFTCLPLKGTLKLLFYSVIYEKVSKKAWKMSSISGWLPHEVYHILNLMRVVVEALRSAAFQELHGWETKDSALDVPQTLSNWKLMMPLYQHCHINNHCGRGGSSFLPKSHLLADPLWYSSIHECWNDKLENVQQFCPHGR